jgi:hypothetical protein
MWRGYEDNGAEFSAGEVVGDLDVQQSELAKQAEVFGILDPEGAARRLGFGEGSLAAEITEKDVEDDFLAQIMRNAGEWSWSRREMVDLVQIGTSTHAHVIRASCH